MSSAVLSSNATTLRLSPDFVPAATPERNASSAPRHVDSALPAPLLQVDNVSLEYHTHERVVRATHRVSFDVHQGDRFVLLGPSGCGKSTLLKAVGGFIAPVEGEIRLDGQNVTAPGPDRIVVFQEFDQLSPW
jgi:NitT/TauT family transport system ATP-binding protein